MNDTTVDFTRFPNIGGCCIVNCFAGPQPHIYVAPFPRRGGYEIILSNGTRRDVRFEINSLGGVEFLVGPCPDHA